MELYPGLRMINAPFENGRQINVWLFIGERRLLVDAGVAGVPTETILPYLEALGWTAGDLDLLINLHAHADHFGGDAELLAASGGALRVGAHALDAPAIADHYYMATRVSGLTDETQIRAQMRRCGADVPVHERYHGGERLDLGGLVLEVIHAPGHTPGNLSLYDPAHRALIHGESVMEPGMADEQGLRPTPFGADPAAYRRTLERLTALQIVWFLSSHRPPADGQVGRAWIDAALAELAAYESVCRDVLAQGVPVVSADLSGSAEAMAHRVAQEGRYRGGPRLTQQVAATLKAWINAGVVVRRAGSYWLA